MRREHRQPSNNWTPWEATALWRALEAYREGKPTCPVPSRGNRFERAATETLELHGVGPRVYQSLAARITNLEKARRRHG